MGSNGIFCLEGEWDADLRHRRSVLPILELLERLGEIKAIHRDVSTEGEVRRYLDRWRLRTYDDYQVLYLATHGASSELTWSVGESTSLDKLADILQDSAKGCYVYLGSCSTLADAGVASFVKKTGVSALLGYEADVDWLEAAAFEVILLAWMANHAGRPSTLFKDLMARHGDLARILEFAITTSSGTRRATD